MAKKGWALRRAARPWWIEKATGRDHDGAPIHEEVARASSRKKVLAVGAPLVRPDRRDGPPGTAFRVRRVPRHKT